MKIKNCLPAICQRRSRWQAGKLKIKFGFTIIDLLVSMAIMTLLTTLSIVSFVQIQRNQELANAAEVIASQIRAVENMAIVGEEVDSGGSAHEVAAGGYGVHFSKSGENISYLFFADMNRDLIYDSTITYPIPFADQEVELKKKYSLPKDVIISQIQINGLAVNLDDPLSAVDLIFKTPTAKIYVNGETDCDWLTIVLTHNLIDRDKKVDIYRISRQISVE